ncbi:MAG: peptide chain release factor 1 [Candidatus Limnocylindria bacterium]
MIERLAELEGRYEELSRLMSTPEVGADPGRLQLLGRELSQLEPLVDRLRRWRSIEEQLRTTRELTHDPDEDMRSMARDEAGDLERRKAALEDELRVLVLPRDPNDERDVILEVRAGAGGDEAALFAAELYRMYTRYAERRRWKVELLTSHESGIGGFKEVIAEIRGSGAFSRLKYERGVHRVQRVPVTESSGRIHTSTATVAVLPEADPVEVEIDDRDLRVDVYRSGGPGGQSVNTTDSAVRITHLPTGLVVAIQDEKSQHKNKAKALAVLRARLLDLEQRRQAETRGDQRRLQVGSGDRSEKIRTYNFPDDRVTDHRIGLTVRNISGLLEGDLDRLVDRLVESDQAEQMTDLAGDGDGDGRG